MNHSEKRNQRLTLVFMIVMILTLIAPLQAAERQEMQRFIIQLHNPPVAAYLGEEFVLPNGKKAGE